MTADYSDQVRFGIRYARRYFQFCFALWREDAIQAATLGAIQAEFSTYREVRRHVRREMRKLVLELGSKWEVSQGETLRRRSQAATRSWEAKRMYAKGVGLEEICVCTGLSVGTVRNVIAGQRSTEEIAASKVKLGSINGNKAAHLRYPGHHQRLESARLLRGQGLTLKMIMIECGYKSEGAVSSALKRAEAHARGIL